MLTSRQAAYFRRKAAWVRVLAGVLLVIAAPLIGAFGLVVVLTSAGPAFFRQVRVGQGGKHFTVFKLRTMYLACKSTSGPAWCKPKDSRITPIGRILRFLHLDELPQLLNVVRGEMDLIGPRPETPEIIAAEKLSEVISGYHLRHQILPGITGLAQINLPADQTVDCVHRKVALDIEYIATANFNLDFRILLCTTLRMAGIRHGLAVRWLGLGRSQADRTAKRRLPQRGPAGVKTRQPAPSLATNDDAPYKGALQASGAVSVHVAEMLDQADDLTADLSRKRPR